jgi:SAM-dependent methyltransferase
MNEVWDREYKSDNSFFGDEPSNFALLCFNDMKINNVQKILELGAGHGRDTIFFASRGIDIEALDYSSEGIKILKKVTSEKGLSIKPRVFDIRNSFPFPNEWFDAVYSHMLFNMKFSIDELHLTFSEIRRVLKPKGLNFFSVRNHNDRFYGSGKETEKEIYDINGFEIRFFTKKKIEDLVAEEGFKIQWIREKHEEPVTLYVVSTTKVK